MDFCNIGHGEKLPPQTGGVNEGKYLVTDETRILVLIY